MFFPVLAHKNISRDSLLHLFPSVAGEMQRRPRPQSRALELFLCPDPYGIRSHLWTPKRGGGSASQGEGRPVQRPERG